LEYISKREDRLLGVLGLNLYPWPERALSRQSEIGGIEGKETSLAQILFATGVPGKPRSWAGCFTLPIFHESFFLTPGYSMKR
jgi:hypothetical protein